jgi:sugar/nucleoside kinase (ribokinase family)
MAQVGSAELAVVAKLGDRGAVSWAGGQARSVAAPRTVGFVDAVGAGDCFNAGYLAGLVRSRHPDECLRLAVATGSLSTRGRGGTTAQSTLAEAEELASTLVARSGHQEAV